MEKVTYIINGNTYDFINEYWETYNAWGHKTTILRNGYEIVRNKIRYYNRTWEKYRFQSCMMGAIDALKEQRYDILKESYKKENNIKRLGGKKLLCFETTLQHDELYKDYIELFEKLK